MNQKQYAKQVFTNQPAERKSAAKPADKSYTVIQLPDGTAKDKNLEKL